MSSLWHSTGAESGILRKNDNKDKLEDLLVFGYACKLFRDDHKALEIDQGKHLIPWMGDNALKIDRYDGRGALSDLKPFEASKEGFDAMRWLGLSESERKLEQLCDEERYYALHTNEDEDELYKEEEKKRLQTNQIHYNYEEKTEKDIKSEKNKTEGSSIQQEEDNEPFVPPPGLDIPINMNLPSTMKQNARIEKTALFISKQGPQMEILLKTKQSGNPQFSFLTQDDPLYRYYRHILMAIKTGRYQIQSEQPKIEQTEKQEEHYLHPSLVRIPVQNIYSAPIIPQINYKPSANCAYSQLINKIKGNQSISSDSTPNYQPQTASTSDQSQQYNPNYVQFYQQYGYWPQIDTNNQFSNVPNSQIGNQMTQTQYEQYLQYATASYPPKDPSNPYAQIVSNVNKSKSDDSKPDSINETPIPIGETTKTPISNPEELIPQNQPSLFSLAQYSGSESEDNSQDDDTAQAVVIPPQDIQLIIDKMASYVAKNGVDFENIVKAKGDPRFIFLEHSHLYNPYYKTKLRENQGLQNVINKKSIDENSSDSLSLKIDEKTDKKIVKPKEKKIITPVCFSIKKHCIEAQAVARDKSALPIEDSSDEDAPKETSDGTADEILNSDIKSIENNDNIIEIEDPIMELIDLTEDLEEKRDRRAEDRVKDKLALAAREKLAAKNRALQLERKKRAAAFLSQLKPQSNSDESKIRSTTPEDGEISEPGQSQNDDLSRLVYQIESEKYSNHDDKNHEKKQRRSRSNSRQNHKNTYHRHKSHKRSHSHSRKRKREKHSRERKKSKRRHRSRSRSISKHRKSDKKDTSDIENKKLHKHSEHYSFSSSEYESDEYPGK